MHRMCILVQAALEQGLKMKPILYPHTRPHFVVRSPLPDKHHRPSVRHREKITSSATWLNESCVIAHAFCVLWPYRTGDATPAQAFVGCWTLCSKQTKLSICRIACHIHLLRKIHVKLAYFLPPKKSSFFCVSSAWRFLDTQLSNLVARRALVARMNLSWKADTIVYQVLATIVLTLEMFFVCDLLNAGSHVYPCFHPKTKNTLQVLVCTYAIARTSTVYISHNDVTWCHDEYDVHR